jgi:hypothetical protein
MDLPVIRPMSLFSRDTHVACPGTSDTQRRRHPGPVLGPRGKSEQLSNWACADSKLHFDFI